MDSDNQPPHHSGPSHTGFYERSVHAITEHIKPSLRQVTKDFVANAVEEHAKGNSRFARIIEFEVRRRGDGAGMTQDVAEPLLWTGIKTGAAASIALLTHSLEKGRFKMIGYASALGLVLNNAVELCRLVPRYKAGLQGSLEMAKDRWEAIEETGVDPFSSQSKTREINAQGPVRAEFMRNTGRKTEIAPVSLMQRTERDPSASARHK